MGDQKHRGAGLFVVVLHLGQDLIPSLGVEAGRRLVQDEDTGLHGHNARHGHAALLSAGQLKGAALQQRFIEADEFCRLVDALIDLRLVEAHILRAEGDVLIARFLKELVLRVLEHQTRQETEIPDLFRLGPEVAAINDDLAAGRFVQTVHVGDEGALAGAGGSDDAHEIALFHLKAHVVQCGDCVRHTGVVDIAQMFYFDNTCHVSVPLTSAAHTEPVRTRRC